MYYMSLSVQLYLFSSFKICLCTGLGCNLCPVSEDNLDLFRP